ncbi:MAG: Nif3-like dinuclear metal center hexameric protein [Chitinophagaceae bacterium]|nr:Nif3-like dinuclear metal center hexameric protein [Chitinophagaceae bacterium]
MKISEIINFLETIAPLSLQESYDNAGLLTGEGDWTCRAALVSLDLTPAVVEEAIARDCNLVISHHPLIFRGLKKINAADPVGRALVASIKHDIAVYAIHTNLDNIREGVNGRMAGLLGIRDPQVLLPLEGRLRKLVVFIPEKHLEPVRDAIWAAGAGQIGRYANCSFRSSGEGSFRAGPGANPFVGLPGALHLEPETRLEVVLPAEAEKRVVRAMLDAHPYEEVAYDLFTLQNTDPGRGAGLVGNLEAPVDAGDFLQTVRQVFQVPVMRHSAFTGRPVQKVAVCGGAGSFLISRALAAGADAFLTADLKYHEFFEPDGRMLLADIGHYESEQYTSDLLVERLNEKFPTFAVLKTGLDTNPIHYFYS